MVPTTVNGWLGRCYAAEHNLDAGGTLPQAIKAFRVWLAAPANRAAAQTALGQKDPQIAKRDFITRKHREYLTAALNGESNG